MVKLKELLQLYRYKHISIKDEFQYDLVPGASTSLNNILEYEKLLKMYKYNIVTSDCGISFSSYEFQEEEIEFINYSQFITMLLCLQKGGACAMKIFLPLARPIALYMHHLLFEYFEEVILNNLIAGNSF